MQKSTNYTGDIVQGIPVINQLNINDLKTGVHRLMFQGAEMNIGQNWYVPIIVAKGHKAGKSFLLNTGVHGDELNGARVIQKFFAELDITQLSGCIIGVLQASPNSLAHISKNWYLSTDGGDFENMNRMFPGKKDGNSAQLHAHLLWDNLWRGNVDYMIDLHSQSTDTEYPLFIFADFRNETAFEMAQLVPVDQIKDDEGEKGTVETTFIEHGIPAITIELGAARIFQTDYINRSLIGIKNILSYLGFIDYNITSTARTQNTYIGNQMTSLRARCGGYADIKVAIGDDVKEDQLLAIQMNAFGDTIEEYFAPVAGKVLSIGTGATREAGGLLVRILYKR